MNSRLFGIALPCILEKILDHILSLKLLGMQFIFMCENIKNTTLILLATKQHK